VRKKSIEAPNGDGSTSQGGLTISVSLAFDEKFHNLCHAYLREIPLNLVKKIQQGGEISLISRNGISAQSSLD
jgi:hypothetical protein